MHDLIQNAETQIENWPVSARAGVPIHRIDFEERDDLAGEYKIFRVPCLVLLDTAGEIVYRQDYPLLDGGPFKLSEFEERIRELESRDAD